MENMKRVPRKLKKKIKSLSFRGQKKISRFKLLSAARTFIYSKYPIIWGYQPQDIEHCNADFKFKRKKLPPIIDGYFEKNE